ncbi:MAG: radical SAM protein [Candidatus Omnitrophica bacterium]|nr:radical SAM protein [Candidatus Omnitrophota bacterium]
MRQYRTITYLTLRRQGGRLMRVLSRFGLQALYYLDNEALYRAVRRLIAPSLLKLLIHITDRCNYRCSYCYVDRARPALPEAAWFDLINQAQKIGIKKVNILGGEPFCAAFLERLLVKIRDAGMRPTIYTNGSLITNDWIARLRTTKPVLIFKFDSDTAWYQQTTGQSTVRLADIERTITACAQAGLPVMTFTTLTKYNLAHIDAIFEASLRCRAFPVFERYLPVADAATNAAMEVSDEECAQAMQVFNRRLHGIEKLWKAALRIAGRGCGCYRDIISITPAGDVLPCPYLPSSASVGNVQTQTLPDVYRLLQAKQGREYRHAAQCTTCEHHHECGGCYTYTYLKQGIFAPHCNYQSSIGFCSYLLIDLYESVYRLAMKLTRAKARGI